MEREAGLAEGMLFVPATSPSPLPISLWMATGCLLPPEGSMALLHSAALEGVSDTFSCQVRGKGSVLAIPRPGAEHRAPWEAPGSLGRECPPASLPAAPPLKNALVLQSSKFCFLKQLRRSSAKPCSASGN